MGSSWFLHSLFILLLAFSPPVFAAKKPYIVYLGSHSHGHDPSDLQLTQATNNHYDLLAQHLGSVEKAQDAIFYSYNKHINGFAAMLEKEEADAISMNSAVVSVFPSKNLQLHTTHSWEFLGLEKNGQIHSNSLWKKARFGQDTIIGNLDTGVWPESQSFNDHDMGPIPSKWKGGCATKGGVSCNRKLIGAQFFNQGYKMDALLNNITVNSTTADSPRDRDGHGSHTLSTAGGRFVPNVNIFGFANGTAKGGSPKARVAAYRVCYPAAGCADPDILAAFDQAIHDGVDVLSLSLGSNVPVDYFEDVTAIGAFHAIQKGITVVCSAGNEGPTPYSVKNTAPWILTVAASTQDRRFQSVAVLGNNVSYKGESMSPQYLEGNKLYPLVSAADANLSNATSADSLLCMPGTLDPKKVQGKILFCLRGESDRMDKGLQAKNAGAVAMILANDQLNGYSTDADRHFLPATHITYKDGLSVLQYINSTRSPVAYVTRAQTAVDAKPAPVMAWFSSQGPNPNTQEILKPDITAPGVSILAAVTQDDGSYNMESGTSMSCPHISGVVGLLHSLHPDWSPAAFRSAIMTTATTQDNLKEQMLNDTHIQATPFNYGAGHVWPSRAADPGLVYDITPEDYFNNFLCGIGYNQTQIGNFTKQECPKSSNILNLNYPTITVPNLVGSVSVSRTVKNVDNHAATYHVKVQEPQGISVDVEPKTLEFKKKGEEKSYKVSFKAGNKHGSDYVFGSLTWSDGKHHVRSHLVVKSG